MTVPANSILPAQVAQTCLVTSTNPQRLSKRYRFEGDRLAKDNAGRVVTGNITCLEVANPESMATLLKKLGHDQALVYGLPVQADARQIVTGDQLKAMDAVPPGTIARVAESFIWPSHATWMMLDYDPAIGSEALRPKEWREIIYAAAPALRDAPHVWAPSASSEIWNSETGEQLVPPRGQRLYFLVADGRDVPRAGQALSDRLWLLRHGYYAISKSGRLLERGPVDTSVWQTNRLDFAAPPVCEHPLESRRSDPEAFNNNAAPLNTFEAIPDLLPIETQQLHEIKDSAKADPELLSRQSEIKDQWIDSRIAHASRSHPNMDREELRAQLARILEGGQLFGDFELTHKSGLTVTVGQVLDDPERWHGERFADPLEPEYSNNDKRIAWLNLRTGGKPTIYSHAHGGQWFELMRPTVRLELHAGSIPDAVKAICERLHIDGDVFERGGDLVRVADGELVPVLVPWLRTRIEIDFDLQRFNHTKGEFRRVDCTDDLAKRVLAARGAWGLPRVAGIVRHPVMRPDGTVLTEPGFDAPTGLLHITDAAVLPRVTALTRPQLQEALTRIWAPFSSFPVADDLSRGVLLSALLTTVCRPTLTTAPAFLVRANMPGTGKTLMSEALMMTAGAKAAAMPLPAANSDEVEKRLFAKLLAGSTGVLLDNLQGTLDHPSLCAFMTSGEPEGRILGRSEVVTLVNRALWILNGNNVSATGDTFRRVLPITLDANTESPERRRFSFDPREVIGEQLGEYRAGLLAVLTTFVAEGAPRVADGSLGSFEAWEQLVRQCVCWIIQMGLQPAPMVDPADVLELSREEDPEKARLGALLEAWHDNFGDQEINAGDAIDKAEKSGAFDDAAAADLRKALIEIAGDREGINAKSLGWYLRRQTGVVIDGLRIDQRLQSRRSYWRVSRVKN